MMNSLAKSFKPQTIGLLSTSTVQSRKFSTPVKMTNSEAFVETLVAHKVTDVFGIVGSAFMDALDLFPSAGIRFIPTQHEQGSCHMADGYARVSGRHGVCIAQNGPGITNFVTAMGAAYWAHSPVVAITPEAGTATKGLGGFQEADQLPIFSTVTKYQAHVNNPTRMAELTARAFDYAMYERGPTQINIPRDFFYGENDFVIPAPRALSRGHGATEDIQNAASILASAKNPVLLVGGGVVMSPGGVDAARALAEQLHIPVCTTYLHNDAFPASHPLNMGPLGYLGHQSAMNVIKDADVVLALGTRISPFGTNPQYGIDYWPHTAKVIQVDSDHRRVGLCKPVELGVCGDAALFATELSRAMSNMAQDSITCVGNASERLGVVNAKKNEWESTLDHMTFGFPELEREDRMRPRQVLRELEKAMPKDAMVSTDIGNSCSVANGYLRFDQSPSFLAAMTFGNCGYSIPTAMGAKVASPDRPAIAYVGDGAFGMSFNEMLTCVRENIPITVCLFHNRQWGAEKKNQVLWFGDRYVGTNLENPCFADIARAMGLEAITIDNLDQVGPALQQSVENQRNGKTTVIELLTTRELGDPFRRDAMKLPQRTLEKYTSTNREEESQTGQPVDL